MSFFMSFALKERYIYDLVSNDDTAPYAQPTWGLFPSQRVVINKRFAYALQINAMFATYVFIKTVINVSNTLYKVVLYTSNFQIESNLQTNNAGKR